MNRQRGMTLLEVLVASAILALTLAAMIYNLAQQANNLSYLQDKTQAAWLAQDLLLLDEFNANDSMRESLMPGSGQGLPSIGKKDGKVEQLGRQWYWTMEVKENTSDEMRSLILSLRLEQDKDDDPLFSLRAFRGSKPALGPVLPSQLPDPAGTTNDPAGKKDTTKEVPNAGTTTGTGTTTGNTP